MKQGKHENSELDLSGCMGCGHVFIITAVITIILLAIVGTAYLFNN